MCHAVVSNQSASPPESHIAKLFLLFMNSHLSDVSVTTENAHVTLYYILSLSLKCYAAQRLSLRLCATTFLLHLPLPLRHLRCARCASRSKSAPLEASEPARLSSDHNWGGRWDLWRRAPRPNPTALRCAATCPFPFHLGKLFMGASYLSRRDRILSQAFRETARSLYWIWARCINRCSLTQHRRCIGCKLM